MPRPRTYSLNYGIASLYLAGLVACCFVIYGSALLLFSILTFLRLNWMLIATIISGIVAYFQLVENPWMNLLKAYVEFRKIDNQVKGVRDRFIWEEIIYRFVNVEVSRWVWELYRIVLNWKTTRVELPPTVTTYKHEPVSGSRSIRLLKILKWSPIHGFRVELEEASLDNIREYEAISYCWGRKRLFGQYG